MEEHDLTQSDLPEIGSQGVVSEILAGKRDLNVRQIAQLAERFGVSPVVFMPISTNRHKPFPTKTRKSRRR
jgi:HTH-type transcriptional regulator/antitoxin HigA